MLPGGVPALAPPTRQQAGAEIAVAAIVLRTVAEKDDDGGVHFVSGLHFLDLEGEAFERVRTYVYHRLLEAGDRALVAASG